MAKIVGLKDVLLPKNQFVNEEIFGMESLKNGIVTFRGYSKAILRSLCRSPESVL